MKFKHFKRYPLRKGQFGFDYDTPDGVTSKSIQVLAGHLSFPEWLEDVELELTIDNNGNIDVVAINTQYYDTRELKEINKFIKMVGKSTWDGWEYMEFYDIRDASVKQSDGLHHIPYKWLLVGDENSGLFNQLNSTQNIKNLQNTLNALNKIK